MFIIIGIVRRIVNNYKHILLKIAGRKLIAEGGDCTIQLLNKQIPFSKRSGLL